MSALIFVFHRERTRPQKECFSFPPGYNDNPEPASAEGDSYAVSWVVWVVSDEKGSFNYLHNQLG